jgi:hypothetical protein
VKVTADNIAQLLATPPPRPVAAQVAAAARKGRAAWSTALMGLFFGAFGMIFVVVFFPWRIWDEMRLASGATSTVTGVILTANDTNMKVNRRQVVAYRFTYTPANGTPQTGDCFETGGRWATGDEVTVRYLPADPGLACIDGARLNEVGWGGVLVVIFPGVGFGMVAWFVSRWRQIGRLLRAGLVAEVDVLSVEETNMKVNKQPVYKIVLAGPAPGSQPVAIKRLNRADLDLANRHLENKQPVFVLYDPRKPAQMIFPEALIEP